MMRMRVFSRRRNFARGLLLSIQILAAHRLRTVLSVSGLLIGVAAVMIMVAIAKGADRRLLEQLQAMGTDLIIINAAPATRVAGRPRQVAVRTDLRVNDAQAIIEESALAIASAPVINHSVVLRREGLNRTTGLTGTTAEGLRIRNIRARSGRLFDDDDDIEQRAVAMLGPVAASSLFPEVDPVGQEVRLGKLRLEVIGVAYPRGRDPLGNDLDDFVAVPLHTAMRRILNVSYLHALNVQATSSVQLEALERDVREILRRRHAMRSGIPESFVILNQAMLLQSEREATAALNRLIPAVAGIALLLGAVGILTVMLMSVRQRTREIGLRRALGASKKDIRIQFIVESAMLGAAGGAAGVLVGLAGSWAAAFLGGWDLIISWNSALLGFACSMILGVAVGSIPAARAASLEPSEALRASW
jgi:putative ABC transport system permease protein